MVIGALAAGASVVLAGQADKSKLTNVAAFNEPAPESYKANFATSQGAFVITVNKKWAPIGADRFYNLVKNGYYDNIRFFRVIPGFMVQFGIHGDPAVSQAWSGANARLKDDPVTQSNKRGFVTFATGGPNTRTTQVFICFGDASFLDKQGFSPFGEVTSGMDVVDKLYNGYGEIYKRNDFDLGKYMSDGNAYMTKQFPKMDYIKSATIGK